MHLLFGLLLILGIHFASPKDYAAEEIKKYGYPYEVHNNVITKDNYILTMHRILPGKNTPEGGEPILLQASIFDCVEAFMFLQPNRSIAFLLADQGYDVWMVNARYTSYSRQHKTLNPDKDKSYWNSTLTEMSYDVMGSIDYILEKTKYDKLFLLGFSHGATVQLIMFSEYPEYNEKVKMMVAFTPAVYLENPGNVFVKMMVTFRDTIKNTCKLLGINELHPGRDMARIFAPTMCSPKLFGRFCKDAIQMLTGYNPEQLELERIPTIVKNNPEGAGLYQFHHYLQLHVNKNFQKYNYGSNNENLRIYNSAEPPQYNLKNVRVPIANYYSLKDGWVNIEGVLRLIGELPNVVDSYQVENELFTHTDFVWAKDVVELLYNRVFQQLDKFRNKP